MQSVKIYISSLILVSECVWSTSGQEAEFILLP